MTAGSITSWIKVDDENEWNNIAKTPCPGHAEPCPPTFGPDHGIEFQTNAASGVFGAAQGWDNGGNNFGPAHASNGGPGGTETPSGVWTHAALTWEPNGDHTIYVNGVPGATVGGAPLGANSPQDWTIGGDGCCGGQRRLRGELADFAIFDGTLTQSEILDIMQFGIVPPDPFVIRGSGETYLQDFDVLGANPSAFTPQGWTVEDDDGIGRGIDSLGLKDGPAGIGNDSIKGIANVGGSAEHFGSSGGGRVATWKTDLDGSGFLDEGDAVADAAEDRALGVFRESAADIGVLNFEIEIAGAPLRAFTFDWDLELWGGDPDDEFRGSDGGGFVASASVGGNTVYTDTQLINPGALLDTEDDDAPLGTSNPTLIDGNAHSLRGLSSGIVEVGGADGAVGNTIQLSFNANVNPDAFGWTPAIDNVRLRALAAGDTDADGDVDSTDIVQLVVADKFAKGPMGVTWEQGDFNGDDEFGSGDLIAVLVGLDGEFPKTFPTFSASEQGTAGDGVPDVIINPFDGTVTVDFEGIDASSMLIKSEAGVFNGAPATWDAQTTFAVNTASEVSNTLLGASMAGIHELGTIVSPQADGFDFNADLTVEFLDAANPTGGLVAGHVIVVPEPSAWVLLGLGSLPLFMRARRRRAGTT